MAPKSKPKAPKRPSKKAAAGTSQAPPPPPPTSSSARTVPSERSVPLPSSTQIRPPPLSHGNPTIQSLLIDTYAKNRYQAFKDKPFVPIYRMTSPFIDSLHIPKLHDLLSCQPMTTFLLDNTDLVYPGMVGQFFANLTFEHSNVRVALNSRVNKVPIRFDSQLLNTIFGTTLSDPSATLYYWDDTHLWPETSDKFKIAELRTMFRVSSREAKEFNPTNLDPVDRVIYHLFVNFVNPVAGHFTNPGKVPLVYYYMFTHQIPIDWGFVVFQRLADTITDHRRNLPHAPFLAPIFQHFKVPCTEVGISPPTFDVGTLTKKGIRLHDVQWITRQEYHSRAQPSSSPYPSIPSSSTQPPPHPVFDGFQLQRTVNELINHVRYLEFGLQLLMPPDVRAEFDSERILYGITSDHEDSGAGNEHTVPEPSGDTDDGTETGGDASDEDGSSDDDDADRGADPDARSSDDVRGDDSPLRQRFKKSKMQP